MSLLVICPRCETLLDTHNPIQSRQPEPKPGNASFCAVCGEVSIYDFDKPGNLRAPTDEETKRVDALPAIRAARAVFAMLVPS